MAGLHQCPTCGYKFEDRDSLESHMEDVPCQGSVDNEEEN